MTERAPKLTLTYFTYSATAETLRLAAAIGKIPFTNKAIDYEEWEPPSGDRTNPRYQLPVLEIEEKGKEVQYIAQTSAILHYLGKRGGLYPPDSLEALQVEYMLETVSEALKPLEMSESGGVLSDNPWTEEELLRVRDRIANDSVCGLPHYLAFFENALRDNEQCSGGKWLVGSTVSIADLQLYHLVCWISGGVGDGDAPSLLKGIKSSLIDNFSLLKSHKMRVETLPEVLSWRAKYSLPYKMFEYRPPFEFRSLGRRARLESRHPAHSSVGGRRGRLSFNMGTARGKWTGTFPKLTLTYFPIMGRAEPIRLAAAIGGVPFTNKAVTREEWAGIKRHTPLGQLPTLSVLQPGKEYLVAPHAVAILRYIGKLSGLYPLDDIEAVHVEFMIETIVEVISMLEVTVTGTVKSLIFDELWEEDQILEIQRRLASNQECGLPFFLRFFESVLERSKWLVGKNLTIADLTLYHLVGWLDGSLDSGIYGGKLGAVDSSILDDYPLVRQHKELVQNYPGATAFHSKYSPPYCTFDFQPPINERENDLGQQQLDNLPKGVRRQKSKELGVPKRRTTPSRKQNFSAPSPVRRRPTQSEGDKDLLEGNKKTDKLLSVPLRKKETFDYYSSIDNDDVDDHNESESKLRTLLFQNESEDNLDISFSDDTEDDYNPNDSRTSLLGSSQSVLLASPKKTREELWDSFRDDSSTTSFDDDSSISSIEHDLETLKNSTLKEIPKSDAGVSPSAIPANLYKKSKHKDSKRKKKKKKKTSKSKKEKPIPILPVNPPRHIPPKRKGKKTARPKKKRHSASIAKQPSEATSTVDNIEKESIDKAALPEAPVNSYSGELSTTLEPQSVSLEAPKDANQAQHQDVVEVPLPPLKPESSKEMATPKAIGRNRTFKFPTNSPRASVRGVRSHHVSQGSSPRRASQEKSGAVKVALPVSSCHSCESN